MKPLLGVFDVLTSPRYLCSMTGPVVVIAVEVLPPIRQGLRTWLNSSARSALDELERLS